MCNHIVFDVSETNHISIYFCYSFSWCSINEITAFDNVTFILLSASKHRLITCRSQRFIDLQFPNIVMN